MRPKVSIIIPTLNEGAEIGRTLDEVRRIDGLFEIIVADGGSADETCEISERSGARVVRSEQGRGIQLHAGAVAAKGDILWFLHADSIPEPDAICRICDLVSDERIVAGNFALRFDGDTLAAAFMTRFYDKIRYIGLLYGDSGIFVRRDVYDQIGGFKRLPLFEDLELMRRLRKHGMIERVGSTIVTSSRRFENRRFLPVFARWVLFQCLYWVGVNPIRLAKYYYPVIKELAADSGSKRC